MKVSLVITNWNGADILKKNLPKVIAAVGEAEVIIVDDASTDNSADVVLNLAEKNANLRLVKKEKNEGFSSTTNAGVEAASGEIVVLLNSDVVPHKDFLKNLLPHFSDPEVFAVGTKDLSHERNGNTVARGRGVGAFKRGYVMHRPGKIISGFTLWANGGSCAVNKSIWRNLGGLNTIYDPAYGEDWDLGYRAWKAGYKILFEPKSIVDHFHEEGSMKKRYSTFYRRAIAFRNQNLFMIVNISDRMFLAEYLLFLPYHLGYKALRRLDFSFWYGFFLFLLKSPRALFFRIQNRKIFVKTDREILSLFSPEFLMQNEEIY